MFLSHTLMSTHMDFSWKTALQAANTLIFQHTGKYLSDLEIIILRGAWENRTYEQIAEAEGYTSSYLCRDVGCKLWGTLSIALKEKVSKKNFKAALQREWKNFTQTSLIQDETQLGKYITKEKMLFPEGSVALGSDFYIERSPIESTCYKTILKPGSLIQIQGAKWMGKTSLVNRILEQGRLQAHKTVYLDFAGVERSILQDSDKLSRWLFVMVSRQLDLTNRVPNYWNTNLFTGNNNCTLYFKRHVLTQIESGLVLALDNIDRLFVCDGVTGNFLRLLCSWHQKGKTDPYWSRLKLILARSTKTPVPLDVDRSSLTLGVPILLEEFTPKQVKTLANLYQLDWDEFEIARLMEEVGGHPYLVRLAMYQKKNSSTAKTQYKERYESKISTVPRVHHLKSKKEQQFSGTKIESFYL